MQERRHLEGLGLRTMQVGAGIGIAVLAATFFLSFYVDHSIKRFLYSYLTSFVFFLSLSLGAFFFLPLQHLVRAGWSVVVRRIAEIMAVNMALLAILFIPILLGMSVIFKWTDANLAAVDHLIAIKQPYLNLTFFLARALFYFAVWIGFAMFFFRNSRQQDESGDPALTLRMEAWSPLAMILFALTLTFASIDWIMSLDPHWFSTIFGVYYFAGSVVGFLSLLVLAVYWQQSNGILQNVITKEHYHDLGKLMFGFVVFWAYIAFSQFMLIWYANIPETTGWFLRRWQGDWMVVSLLLFVAHFVIPFFGLISRYPKRQKNILAFWAIWLLVVHYIDLYWLIMPEYGKAIGAEGIAPFSLLDIGCLIGMGGLYVAGFAFFARGSSLVPMKDPRIKESLNFHNV